MVLRDEGACGRGFQERHRAFGAFDGMLAAIDAGGKDSVYVMSIEDGENIAGMGGFLSRSLCSAAFLPQGHDALR